MSPAILQHRLEQLEEELQLIKWQLAGFPRVFRKSGRSIHSSIVQATSGILGKNFPSGQRYEDSIRKSWRHHNER